MLRTLQETMNSQGQEGQPDKKATPDYIDPDWDDTALYDLVNANADVRVRLGGGVVTVSEAVCALPKSMWTADNQPNIIAYVEGLLANRVEETEELKEERTEENKSGAEENEALDEPSSIEEAVSGENLHDQTLATQENQTHADKTTAPPSAQEGAPNISSQTSAEAVRDGSYQTDLAEVGLSDDSLAVKIEQPAKETTKEPASVKTAHTQKNITSKPRKTGKPVAIKPSAPRTAPPLQAMETNKKRAPLRARVKELLQESKSIEEASNDGKQQVPASETPENSELTGSAAGTETEHAAIISPTEENNSGILRLPITEEKVIEPEIVESLSLPAAESGTANSHGNSEGQAGQELQLPELEVGLSEARPIEESQPVSFEEDEIIYLHPSENGPSPLSTVEPLAIDEQITSDIEENAMPVEHEVISLSIEEIEESLAILTGQIKGAGPEENAAAYEVMDKIIEVSTQRENEEEAKEELKKLFTELFDSFDIDYSPELIEALAALTLRWNLMEEFIEFKKEKATDTPKDRGTHEIIKKLLAGLSKIKKAIVHACKIGKSAIRLYGSYDFTFAKAATPATIV